MTDILSRVASWMIAIVLWSSMFGILFWKILDNMGGY